MIDNSMKNAEPNVEVRENADASINSPKRGMILPFQPLSLAFNHVNYCVDMPAVSQPSSNVCIFNLYIFCFKQSMLSLI